MVDDMDLVEGLRSFCAVSAERSFTRGAELCGVPQPAVSRRVAALERRLGATLLVRTSRRVELTTEGERLLPLARDLLGRADRLVVLFGEEPELVLAVPLDLPTATRARIRRGLVGWSGVRFFEAAPAERADAVRGGSAGLGVLATARDEAELVVALGLGHDDHDPAPRLHLDQLRRPARDRRNPPRAIHLLTEDDVPAVRDPVRAACFAAGLRADQVVLGTSVSEAWTRVHERGDVVLAAAVEARRQEAAWSALAVPVARGYRLAGDVELEPGMRTPLLSRLAQGLGGKVTGPPAPGAQRPPSWSDLC